MYPAQHRLKAIFLGLFESYICEISFDSIVGKFKYSELPFRTGLLILAHT